MVPIALTPTETAERVVDVNLMGTFLLTRAAVRLLKNSKNGRIINLSTVAVPLRLEGEAIYVASKAAVEAFTRVTAKEFGAMGLSATRSAHRRFLQI